MDTVSDSSGDSAIIEGGGRPANKLGEAITGGRGGLTPTGPALTITGGGTRATLIETDAQITGGGT